MQDGESRFEILFEPEAVMVVLEEKLAENPEALESTWGYETASHFEADASADPEVVTAPDPSPSKKEEKSEPGSDDESRQRAAAEAPLAGDAGAGAAS